MLLKSAEEHISISVFALRLYVQRISESYEVQMVMMVMTIIFVYLFIFLVTRQLNDQLRSQHQHAWNGRNNESKTRRKCKINRKKMF